MTTQRYVRVSDADRDAVAAQLREHFAHGRLTLEELHQRLDLALASKTQADLDTVMSDLPYTAPHRMLPSDKAQRGGWQAGGGWQPGYGRSSWDSGWNASGGGWQSSGHSHRYAPLGILRIIPVLLCVWVCIALLGALSFGGGSGGPLLILFFAIMAIFRWLFGRRRWFPSPRRGPGRPWWR